MRVYRITKVEYLEVITGLGASYQDGARWNFPGIPVLYFALSASVAMLEMANYTSSPRMVPPSYRLGVYELPDDAPIVRLEQQDWPEDWADFPYPVSTQNIGQQWLRAGKDLGLILPSCAVAAGLGKIILLNPAHAAAKRILLLESHAGIYNPRAFHAV